MFLKIIHYIFKQITVVRILTLGFLWAWIVTADYEYEVQKSYDLDDHFHAMLDIWEYKGQDEILPATMIITGKWEKLCPTQKNDTLKIVYHSKHEYSQKLPFLEQSLNQIIAEKCRLL